DGGDGISRICGFELTERIYDADTKEVLPARYLCNERAPHQWLGAECRQGAYQRWPDEFGLLGLKRCQQSRGGAGLWMQRHPSISHLAQPVVAILRRRLNDVGRSAIGKTREEHQRAISDE